MPSDVRMVTRPKVMNRELRRQVLLADPNIKEVEENRVFCHPCKRWVALKKMSPYNLWTWKRHISQANHLARVFVSSASQEQTGTHLSRTTSPPERQIPGNCIQGDIIGRPKAVPATKRSEDDLSFHGKPSSHRGSGSHTEIDESMDFTRLKDGNRKSSTRCDSHEDDAAGPIELPSCVSDSG